MHGIGMTNLELMMLTKNGGGVGINLNGVRGRGSVIKNNGMSEGVIPWAKIFESSILASNQGGTRKGAASVNLYIDHKDIEEFLRIRRASGDVNRQCLNINHCILITDEFMHKVENGDAAARKLFKEILQCRMETGEPYIMYIDNANRANPEAYVKNNLKVSMTNICCLSGDTLVWTEDGHQKIEDLVGKKTKIYDGENIVETDTFEYKGDAELYRVHLKDGSFIDCTDNHRWFVSDYGTNVREVLTRDLQVGDILEESAMVIDVSYPDFPDNKGIYEIEKLDGVHKVYCPSIPSTGKFALANGVMTGNSEIILHTDDDHGFVCDLASLNLVEYDNWKDTDLVKTTTIFLDCVMEEFLNKAANIPGFERVYRGALKGRPIGIGVIGWHTLLQKKMLPFDTSLEVMRLNSTIFKQIRDQSFEASRMLAKALGEPEWCKGTGMRNTHTMAVAPTVTNAKIAGGHSPSIEPIAANAYADKTSKGIFMYKNPILMDLLQAKGKDTPEVWKSIVTEEGSVQHLDFLTELEKQVFLTAREMNQLNLVTQAAGRGVYIDQGQSLNLFFPANVDAKWLYKIHLDAWKKGLKTLYYTRTSSILKGDLASRFYDDGCVSCEG
jgi:ribonucleotide reductase alpha subunit